MASFIASLIPLVGDIKFSVDAISFFFGLNITDIHSAGENDLNCLEEVRVITLVPTGDRRLQVEIPVHSLTDDDYVSLKIMPVVGQDPTLATIPDLIRSSGSAVRARPTCDAPPAPGSTPPPVPTATPPPTVTPGSFTHTGSFTGTDGHAGTIAIA